MTRARTSGRISKLLSVGGLLWCAAVSVWLWVTPLHFSGSIAQAWSSSGPSGQVASGAQIIPVERHQRLSEISLFGPLPLFVPVLLAALATWAAWRDHRLALGVSTAMLLAFCVLAGFSIGRGYLVGGGAMLLALLVLWDAEPDESLSTR